MGILCFIEKSPARALDNRAGSAYNQKQGLHNSGFKICCRNRSKKEDIFLFINTMSMVIVG